MEKWLSELIESAFYAGIRYAQSNQLQGQYLHGAEFYPDDNDD